MYGWLPDLGSRPFCMPSGRIDGIPPVAGRPGRPHRRPDSPLGDKGYDSNSHREELRKRRILPVISRKGAPNIKGLGKLRCSSNASPSAGNAEPKSTTPQGECVLRR
jgi:hypothetical protein